jgi:hypothetical protein
VNIEKLNESVNECKNGILASYRATFMQFNKVNENNRIYPSEIGKNKVLCERTMQAIKENKLLGEINHPKDRFDVDYEKVAINTTSLYYDEPSDSIKGTFDILDTPMGRILKTLVDYGTHISISARAMGKTRNVKGVDEIVEESYMFKTFDAVTDPGFSIATIDPAKDKINESLREVYESFNEDEKSQVAPILESIGMPVDFLYSNVTSQDNVENDNEDNQQVFEDKSDIQNLIKEYESIIAILQEQSKCKDEKIEEVTKEHEVITQLMQEKIDKQDDKIEELQDKLEESNNVLNTLVESIKSSRNKIDGLNELLQESESKYSRLEGEFFKYVKSSNARELELNESNNNLLEVQENSSKEIERVNIDYKNLLEQYKELEEKYQNSLNECKELSEQLDKKVQESFICNSEEDLTLLNVIVESKQDIKNIDNLTDKLLNKLNKK